MFEQGYLDLAGRPERDHTSFIWHLLSEADITDEEFGPVLKKYKDIDHEDLMPTLNEEEDQAVSLVVHGKVPLALQMVKLLTAC